MTTRPFPRPARSAKGQFTLSLPRIYPRKLALALMLLMTAQAFFFLPGMSIPNEFWNVLCFLFLCFVYLAWKAKSGERFLGFEFYTLALMIMAPLWGGFMAQHVFGQPVIYGILAQRSSILGVGALALLMFHRLGWVDSEDCKDAFLILAWANLILYSGWSLLSFGSSSTLQGGDVTAGFNYVFVEIGFYYYALIGFNKKSYLHYMLAAPFLLYMISTGQRAQLLTMLGAYGLFVLLRGSFSRLIVFVPTALIGFAALIGVVYLVNPPYLTNLAVRIDQAVSTVTTGQHTQDSSSNARLYETATALPYISNSPLMGNGEISNKWHGGYQGVVSAHFFPSDIGIFGVLYRYGALGAILFAFQFWWARKYGKAASRGAHTPPMVDAVMAFLVAYAVISIESGMYANKFPTGLLMIAFLYINVVERKGLRTVRRRRRHARHPAAGAQAMQRLP